MKDTLCKQIGRRVRKRREYLGLTREVLAEWAELSMQFLADVETGKKSMTTNTLYRVARALNTTTDSLVFGQQDATERPAISAMFSILDARDRAIAEEMLALFVKAVTGTE